MEKFKHREHVFNILYVVAMTLLIAASVILDEKNQELNNTNIILTDSIIKMEHSIDSLKTDLDNCGVIVTDTATAKQYIR